MDQTSSGLCVRVRLDLHRLSLVTPLPRSRCLLQLLFLCHQRLDALRESRPDDLVSRFRHSPPLLTRSTPRSGFKLLPDDIAQEEETTRESLLRMRVEFEEAQKKIRDTEHN
jgi:hypothetical protein